MFIDTALTPNPDVLKFLPDRVLMEQGSVDFTDFERAQASPLAVGLFAIDGVVGVYIGRDFVSVTKNDSIEWDALRGEVLAKLLDFFTSGAPVIADTSVLDANVVDDSGEDAELINQINTLIDEKIRPAVAGDGGDIVYKGFKEGVVYLQMQGACSGCPSSTITLKHGIENLLKYYVPEVTEVQAI